MTSNTEKSSQILKEEIQRLEEQGISGHILEELMEFRRENDTGDAAEERCIRPQIPFFGKEVLEMAIAALLAGENVLLCGGKATGKNILAENLAWLFRRPTYNISFHVNTDSSTLIGTDTFRNNEVQLREGPIIQCAKPEVLGSLMKSTWQKTMPYRCCMQLWITAGQLMCRDTKELHFIRLRVLSVR